jgi:Holliday junction resolvase RusA-like endonuclease
MIEVSFIVPGQPRGKARARFNPRNPHQRPYTPTATRLYEASIGYMAKKAMQGLPFLRGPVQLSVEAYFQIPKNWSKADKRAARANLIRPEVKPDWDNIGKVTDALKNIVWQDDAHVVDGRVQKFYGDDPRLVVVIRTLSLSGANQQA